MSRGRKGEVTQKPQYCKLDINNWQWLQNQPNKNRAINNAIFKYRFMEKYIKFEEYETNKPEDPKEVSSKTKEVGKRIFKND